ncbi:MAG: hypothetical protein FJ405_12775 [Verrucomicrobia bacterium]|nr:hypothetical protein [Verrucomicrobiota bacterium]
MGQWVHLNGEFVESSRAMVPISDRGFLYGDGVFETTRVCQRQIIGWKAHWARFEAGLSLLRMDSRLSEPGALKAANDLVQRNNVSEGYVRWSATRGAGPRGYGIQGCGPGSFLIQAGSFPQPLPSAPRQWKLITSTWTLPLATPISRVKHSSKLLHVLAKAHAQESGADEPVLCNQDGWVVEAASANIAWIRDNCLFRPMDSAGALPGVFQEILAFEARRLGLGVETSQVTPMDLFKTEGVLLTLSTLGVVEATELDRQPLPLSPWTFRLWEACEKAMQAAAGRMG